MERIKSITSSIGSYIYTTDDGLDTELLGKANALSTLFAQHSLDLNLSIPRIVVAGQQSSAKSSILNAVSGLDILPTKSTLCTRAPLSLQLYHDTTQEVCKFYLMQDGARVLKKTLPLGDPTRISTEIEYFTNVLGGTQKGISKSEIILEVRSAKAPNLSVVDIPGITQLSLTSEGQPEDIKQQIIDLISHYISDENTIILAVMPAREDLEADVCLDIVKQCNPNLDRTVGILSKPDVCGNFPYKYLTGEGVSQDLLLGHGYYSVKLGGNPLYTHVERLAEEKAFFVGLPDYKTFQHRTGVENLTKALSKILKTKLEQALPSLGVEVNDALAHTNAEIAQLGGHLPATSEAQGLFLSNLVAAISREFVDQLEKGVSITNYGRQLKEIFIDYREEIHAYDFLDEISDEYLDEVISNAHGNRMANGFPLVEILESIVLDYRKNVLVKFIAPSHELVDRVVELLMTLLAEMLEVQCGRFMNLVTEATQRVQAELNGYSKHAKDRVREAVSVEAAYIWSTDRDFLTLLEDNATRKAQDTTGIMREIVTGYIDTVKVSLNNQIPKLVMFHVVKKIESKLHHHLTSIINQPGGGSLERWLDEDQEIVKKRKALMAKQRALVEARRVLGAGDASPLTP